VDAARLQMEEMILKTSESSQVDGDDDSLQNFASDLGILSKNEKKKQLKENDKLLVASRHFLDKPVIQYGTNRLLSSHNCKGLLEAPWSTVGGRYQTLPGDRSV
jgi:hypothetical protein